MDNYDPVLSEGKVCVTFPAVFVSRLLGIILCKSIISIIISSYGNIDTNPVIIVLWYDDRVDVIPSPAVPEYNPVLVSGAEEVPIQVHGEVPRLLFQLQGRVIDLQTVE